MRNKNAKMILTWIGALILFGIILFLLLLSYFGKDIGLFTFFTEKVKGAQSMLPGKGPLNIKETQQTDKFDAFFNSFVAALKDSRDKGDKCIVKYPNINNFGDFRLELLNSGNNLAVRKKNEIGQVGGTQETIENLNFCIIKPKEFFENYLTQSPIKPTYKTDFEVGNRMEIAKISDYASILYKPTKDKICFIKMYSDTNYLTSVKCDKPEGNTLDDDCIEPMLSKFRLCSAGDSSITLGTAVFNNFASFMKNTEKKAKNGGFCHITFDLKDMEKEQHITIAKTNNNLNLFLRVYKNDINSDVSDAQIINQLIPPIPYSGANQPPLTLSAVNTHFNDYDNKFNNFKDYAIAPYISTQIDR